MKMGRIVQRKSVGVNGRTTINLTHMVFVFHKDLMARWETESRTPSTGGDHYSTKSPKNVFKMHIYVCNQFVICQRKSNNKAFVCQSSTCKFWKIVTKFLPVKSPCHFLMYMNYLRIAFNIVSLTFKIFLIFNRNIKVYD